uniref:Uncharacterized protein n=1 Tax=Arundo donax TaxID=35708 RepID=A0A0A9C0B1_ARUDO
MKCLNLPVGLLSLGQISLFSEPLFEYRLHAEQLWTGGVVGYNPQAHVEKYVVML